MSSPVPTVIGSNASIANTTSLVVTLTVAASVGDLVEVFTYTNGGATAIDSKGNTYTSFSLGSGNQQCLTSLVTTALVIGDTITITQTSGTIVALAAKFSGVTYGGGVLASQGKLGPITTGSTYTIGSYTPTSDICSIAYCGHQNSGLSSDFLSIDNGYTLLGHVTATGTGFTCDVMICYKNVSANTLISATTFTFNRSLSNNNGALVEIVGKTARSTLGVYTRMGDAGSNTSHAKVGSLNSLGRVPYGQVSKSVNDGFPKQAITPGKAGATRPDSDGILLSE